MRTRTATSGANRRPVRHRVHVQRTAQVAERELKYFVHHLEHLNYPEVKVQGCPLGSGAVELTCSQLQDRFKRAGQFWSQDGQGHLLALELARRNDDWDALWNISP